MVHLNLPRVVILGAGFGGLFAAHTLKGKPVEVIIIDRNNYHTFTPLLYQVATCALDPSDVARPVRTIFQNAENIQFLMGEISAIDTGRKAVEITSQGLSRSEPYDYLVIATGSTPTYFGNDQFRPHAFELRTLEDAIHLRDHILRRFERAIWIQDPAERRSLTTIVVVGGGPTGLETAGAVFELYNHVLDREYKQMDLQARVVLVEMQPFLLAPYPEKLRQAALDQLQSLGVEVMLEHKVVEVNEDHIILDDGSRLETHTLVWAAGMKASSIAEMLNVPLRRNGQIPITPMTEVVGLESVFAVGDIAYLEDDTGAAYPMLIPVAQQQAKVAAKNILAAISGRDTIPFRYLDRGIMATIGRRRAVAWLYYRIMLSGWLAWLGWLAFHLITLIGFRSRVKVLISWIWNYFTYDRSVRIIWQGRGNPETAGEAPLPPDSTSTKP